jgi:glycosyltransferase involved in cell wall biosynthesis
MSLSVCLATYNEGKNLEDCLQSIKQIADEIIVVDGNSTDETVKIAKKFKARVFESVNHPIFHIQKQLAVDKANSGWILVLDADERVTPELAEEIKITINSNPSYSGFWIKRKKKFLGKWITSGGQYPDPVIRLFRKDKGHHPQKSVHEQIEIDGEVGWLESELIHLPTPSFPIYILKDNRYSTLFAKELYQKDPGTGLLNFFKLFVFKPILIFFSLYVRHKGFVDGFPGFVFAFYSGLTYASSYVKYWELKHNPESISRVGTDWA